MPRKTIATIALVAAAAMAQANGSEGNHPMRHSTGTATIASGKGMIELISAGGGVRVTYLSGAFSDGGVLAPGDLITAVDGVAVGTPEDLFGHIRDRPASKDFALTISRSGEVFVRRVGQNFFRNLMTPKPPEPPPVP